MRHVPGSVNSVEVTRTTFTGYDNNHEISVRNKTGVAKLWFPEPEITAVQ